MNKSIIYGLLDVSKMDYVKISEYKKCLIACLKIYDYSEEDHKKITDKINTIDKRLGLNEKQINP